MKRLITVLVLCCLGLAGTAQAQNPTPPAATTGDASAVSTTGATVSATIDPKGADTKWAIEYGTSTGYGLTTGDQMLGASSSSTSVTQALSALTPATTYHYRVTATNAAGTTKGADKTLTTATPTAPPAPAVVPVPGVETRGATSITGSGAVFNGRVDPNGAPTNYFFQYGTTAGLGYQTAATPTTGAADGARNVTQAIGGLTANTTYYYRLVAQNAGGTKLGATVKFATAKTAVSLALGQPGAPLLFGKSVTLQGQLLGSTISRQIVKLQSNPYPYTRGFRSFKTLRSTTTGALSYALTGLTRSAQFRLAIGKATSPVATVEVRPVVTFKKTYLSRKRVRLYGYLQPGNATGTVSIQRQDSQGHWTLLKRATLTPGRTYSRFTTTSLRRTRTLRAVYRHLDHGLLRANSVTRHIR